MAGHPRPVDWKLTLHGTCIRMAHAASLDAYPHLAWPRIAIGLPHELKPSRGHRLHRLVGRRAVHQSTPSADISVSRRHARSAERVRDRGDAIPSADRQEIGSPSTVRALLVSR